MADVSLDEVRQRKVKFASANVRTMDRSRIGGEPSGDARSRIIQKKRANITDARQKLHGTTRISLKRPTGIKQRITAPGNDNNSQVSDARSRIVAKKQPIMISTKKNLQTGGRLGSSSAQRVVNDYQNKNVRNGSGRSDIEKSLLRTLNSITGGRQNNFGGRFSGGRRTVVDDAPQTVHYIEEVPTDVEYEELAYADDDYDMEPMYQYEEAPAEIVVEEPVPVRTYRPTNISTRPRQVGGYQPRNHTMPAQNNRSQGYVNYQNGNNHVEEEAVDYLDGGYDNSYDNVQYGMSQEQVSGYAQPRRQMPTPWANQAPVQQKRPSPAFQPAPAPAPKRAISKNLRSRLDQNNSSIPNMNNPGYKVIVSNLHPKVTLEDIKELFGNIGPLRDAFMLTVGMAEVYFNTEMDAQNSVKAYNQRKLDGQAMNVCSVSKKSMNSYMPGGGQAHMNRMSNTGNASFLRAARGGRSGYIL